MCDYSLMHAKSRPAAVGDRLVTKNFGRGTTGFAAVEGGQVSDTAVCLLPGTEIAFVGKPRRHEGFAQEYECPSDVGIFRQINKENLLTHHDIVEFADGLQVLLTHLTPGQEAVVLQLPAAPKTEAEAKEQERLAIAA